MKLHQDKNAFRVLLEHIHERTGYRTDVLEKDYYVVLMLRELAEKQKDGLQAYFKGGTALYKALKTTNRFSEDIDLSVDTRGCSRSQEECYEKLFHSSSSKPIWFGSGFTSVRFPRCCPMMSWLSIASFLLIAPFDIFPLKTYQT